MYIIRFTREYIFAFISPLVKKKPRYVHLSAIFSWSYCHWFCLLFFYHISLNFLFTNILINTEFSHLYVIEIFHVQCAN